MLSPRNGIALREKQYDFVGYIVFVGKQGLHTAVAEGVLILYSMYFC